MSSDDGDGEPRLKAVENYYFVNDNDAPISFDALPFQFDAAEEVPSFKKDVYLRGFTDGGLQKVYKQVVAWKLGLDGRSPEITVLSTEGSWIVLLKPRTSYEETVRSVLITVEMLHFLRTRPTDSENMWDHLRGVFDKFVVRPSEDDLRNHQPLIKLFAERDPVLANSQILQGFIKDKTVKKIDEVGLNNREVRQMFIAHAEEIEDVVEDDIKHEPSNDNDEDDEEDEDLFDSVCAICDNGGELLCCEGPCMRSFHAKIVDGKDSYCATLGYTKAQLNAIQNFLCKNCEHKKHQCFVCGELDPSDGLNAKVFICNNATCGHFYHPKCVAQLLHPNNRNEASELENKIAAGFSFTCPVHWCFRCKGLEDRTQEPLQFAVCRRCPRSYHRKCLPREISFEDIDEKAIITRAWKLPKRILIYCLDHDIDLDIGTPSRNHIKFPQRALDDSYVDEPLQKAAELPEKFHAKDGEKARRADMKSSLEQHVFEPEKKNSKYLKETQLEASSVECAADASSPKQSWKEQEQELGALSSLATGKTPSSSFPIVDSEIEK